MHYHNKEIKTVKGGRKMVRKVSIKGKTGHKSVTHYSKGKRGFTVKKVLTRMEIGLIQAGKFIPGLFKDCGCAKKTRKNR